MPDNPATPSFDPPSPSTERRPIPEGSRRRSSARPARNLEITATFGLIDGEFDADAPAANIERGFDLPRAPRDSFGVSARYTAALGGTRSLTLFGEILEKGDHFLTADNQPDGLQESYLLLNGDVVFDFNSRWGISIWGKNLDDEVYLTASSTWPTILWRRKSSSLSEHLDLGDRGAGQFLRLVV